MTTTYAVRVWKLQTRHRQNSAGKKSSRYVVRWQVNGDRFEKSYPNRAQADSLRSDLMSAARRGEAFDEASGMPVAKLRTTEDVSWFDLACAYSDSKWRDSSAGHRRNIAVDLSAITQGMLDGRGTGRPDDVVLRQALRTAFNTKRRAEPHPAAITDALGWLARHTRMVGDLADPAVLRALVSTLDRNLDGSRAAPDTIRLRRTTLSGALEYAVERNALTANPLRAVKVRRNRTSVREVDKRAVPNPVQARTLLRAVKENAPRLEAFFALLYFAALRPEEAANLRKSNLSLPKAGWGEIHLDSAAPEVSGDWTDTGAPNEEGPLKHRQRNEGRPVPCCPELTAAIHEHLKTFGTAPDGRLFWGVQSGGRLASSVYGRAWARARSDVFTSEVANSVLAKRPYDLRHAAVSTWLSAGVEAPRVARWAGHSLAVLLRVYASFLDAGEEEARRRVEHRLRS